MMNPQAKEIFDTLTSIMPDQLTKEEIAFVRARRDYLRPEQVEAFKSILKDTKPMSDKDRKEFEEKNKKAILDAKKEAEELAKETKTVKESQNPNND